jgi:hypothetical protein
MSENKITFPVKLASNNPQSFGIVDATEISGHRSVDTISELYDINDSILSILKDGSDAIGQEWFVVSEDCKYRLDNWGNRKSIAGWTKLPKQELINTKQSVSEKDQPSGYAGLDSNGKIPIEKTYGDTATVTDVATYESLPATGLNGVIYNVLNTGAQYKWSGSVYIDITDGADNAKKNETSIFDCSNGTSTKYYSSLSDALNVVPLVYKTSNRIISYLSVEYPQVELIVNKAATVDGSISIYLDGVLKSTISVTAGMTAIEIADKLSDSTYVDYAPWSWTDSGVANKFTLTYGNNNIAKKITTYSYAADSAEESGLISFNILKEGFAPTAVNYQYNGIDSTTWSDLTKWERIPNQTDLAEIRSDLSNLDLRVDDVKSDIQSKQIVAGAGLTGGGAISSDRTLNVISANDGITVNADNIQLNAIDSLLSTSITKPLSANQGRAIDVRLSSAESEIDNLQADVIGLDSELNSYRQSAVSFEINTLNELTITYPDTLTDDYSINENGELILTY